MGHRALFLRRQLSRARENLEFILERQAEYVLEVDIPLQFVKEERQWREKVADFETQLDLLKGDSRRPYRGLEPFWLKQADFYFGRDAMAATLFQKVMSCPLVTVVGPSGCGKSSLIHAGLCPLLRESGRWLFATCKPERAPFHALAHSLVTWLEPGLSTVDRMVEAGKLAEALKDGSLGPSRVVDQIRKRHDETSFLLVIDQFEELYTQGVDN